jgi:hypothetical protein
VTVGSACFADGAFDRSTLAEIQRKIIKMGKRNAVARLLHAKNDKETILTWKSDLSKILLVFNVSSIVALWPLLTVHSQTELAINTHVAVSDMRHEVSNVQNGVTSTHDMVSDIHHIITKGQEGADGSNLPVSTTRPLATAE